MSRYTFLCDQKFHDGGRKFILLCRLLVKCEALTKNWASAICRKWRCISIIRYYVLRSFLFILAIAIPQICGLKEYSIRVLMQKAVKYRWYVSCGRGAIRGLCRGLVDRSKGDGVMCILSFAMKYIRCEWSANIDSKIVSFLIR